MNRRKITSNHIEYVSPAEMAEIKSNKKLMKRLKAGRRDAKAMRGNMLENEKELN